MASLIIFWGEIEMEPFPCNGRSHPPASMRILNGLNEEGSQYSTYADVEVDDAVGGGLSVIHGVRPLVGVHVARHDRVHLVAIGRERVWRGEGKGERV